MVKAEKNSSEEEIPQNVLSRVRNVRGMIQAGNSLTEIRKMMRHELPEADHACIEKLIPMALADEIAYSRGQHEKGKKYRTYLAYDDEVNDFIREQIGEREKETLQLRVAS